jgi:hypothetical protein
MITATVGRLFLDAYNEINGTSYDPRGFFTEKFYPLFFNHQKYMMTAGNAPLENPKISWGDMLIGKKDWESSEKRKDRYEKTISKIDSGEADASIARGFPTLDDTATTSGQVTDMSMPLSSSESYLSWIGDALGVGVKGGFTILFFDKNLLLDIYKGWHYYREALDNTRMLKGNQINTWNGQWLKHYEDPDFNSGSPLSGFSPYETNNGIINISLLSWTQILISILRKYQEIQSMTYIYNIGQTNTTVGFIPFDISGIRRPVKIYEKLFGANNVRSAEPLWGTGIAFIRACQKGVIGIEAMKPKGIEEYIRKGIVPKAANSEEQKISYNVYLTWLLAMLNNDGLWEKSQKMAELLISASTDNSKKISTKSSNLVGDALKAVNKKQFIDAVTAIIPAVDNVDALVDIVKEINDMPSDNVPYFLTLVRFQYGYLNKSSK